MLVPTRELGVQTALLVYRLFGGNPTANAGIPGQAGNMFQYSGPRGLQVTCFASGRRESPDGFWFCSTVSRKAGNSGMQHACASHVVVCLSPNPCSFHCQVRGVLDDEEAEAAQSDRGLRKAHVIVATPPALAAALASRRPPLDIGATRFLVVDEVDACFQVQSVAASSIFDHLRFDC